MTAIVEASVIKGVSCYGAHDAVVRVAVEADSSDKDFKVELIRVPTSCDCDKECLKPCKFIDLNVDVSGNNTVESPIFIFDNVKAGTYEVLLTYKDAADDPQEATYDQITVREAVKVDLFGKPATAPWNSNDGAIEGVVYGTAGVYRVSLYVGYVHSSLQSLSLDTDDGHRAIPIHSAGPGYGALGPVQDGALGYHNFQPNSAWLARYTAAYTIEVLVDDANGGRFAFGALKPGQYTVVVETLVAEYSKTEQATLLTELVPAELLAILGETVLPDNHPIGTANNWVQSATATVYVGVDYIRTIFRLLGLVFSVAVLTWLFRHVYTLLVDVIENIIPAHKL